MTPTINNFESFTHNVKMDFKPFSEQIGAKMEFSGIINLRIMNWLLIQAQQAANDDCLFYDAFTNSFIYFFSLSKTLTCFLLLIRSNYCFNEVSGFL